jgi:hypothetical protein
MVFNTMHICENGKVTGSGSDPSGNFTVEGNMHGKEIKFVKKYPSHGVNYEGLVDS